MTEKITTAKSKTSPAAAREIETSSHIAVNPLYTPADLKGSDYESDVGYPGEYPFTRGVQATMYRGRLWTMRQYAGMGDAEESNKPCALQIPAGQWYDRDCRWHLTYPPRSAWTRTIRWLRARTAR